MKIAILQVDAVDPAFLPRFGEVDDMMRGMLNRAAPGQFEFATFLSHMGDYPPNIDAFDGFLITGSKKGVYDKDAWIAELLDYIQFLDEHQKKMVGICFGHQAVAAALGGKVEQYQGGWGIGVQTYSLTVAKVEQAAPQVIDLLCCHQDQVMDLPPRATRTLSNTFCANAGFRIDDHVFTVQPHPEFAPEYVSCLIETLADRLDGRYESARASMDTPVASDLFARHITAFLLGTETEDAVTG